MSGFFNRLVARSFTTPADVLRPKLPSLFEMPAEGVPVSPVRERPETREKTADETMVRPAPDMPGTAFQFAEEETGEPDVRTDVPNESKPSAVGRSLRERADTDSAARRTISPSLAEASYVPASGRRRDVRTRTKLFIDDARDSNKQKSLDANQMVGADTQDGHGAVESGRLEPRSLHRPAGSRQKTQVAAPAAVHVEATEPGANFRPNVSATVLRPAPLDAQQHADVKVLPLSDQSRAVHISIGRIEVRAVTPSPPVQRQTAAPARPRMSLDDYLRRRNEGER